MNEKDKKYFEKILNSYQEKETSKIDELRELDKKATKPAKVFAYVFGTIGSLILGFGMCIAMQVILAELMWLGILVGVIGILMVSANYFIYKKLLAKGKEKYAEQILSLSNAIINE